MNKNKLSILILSLVGIAASTVIPWFNIDAFGQKQAVYGTAGDGVITAFLYAIPALVSLLGLKSESLGAGAFLGVLIPSIIALGVGGYDLYNATNATAKWSGIGFNPFGEGIVVGSGLYLVILSGLIISFRAFSGRKKAS